MHTIKWNNGMSVGVKALDDDHKKLLEILNILNQSIYENQPSYVIENIFSDFKKLVLEHFRREESFLQLCKCESVDEHIAQHQTFIDNAPDIRTKLLNKKNPLVAQEASGLLTDWVLTHIITEDVPMSSLFQKCGISQNSNEEQAPLQKLIKKVSDTFSYRKRIMLIMIIPLLGMLILGAIILWNNYKKYEEMNKIMHVSHIVSDVNELVHTMQTERDLSSGYLTSENNKFLQSLLQQYNNVDNQIKEFIVELETIHSEQAKEIKPLLKRFKHDIPILNNFRKITLKKRATNYEAIKFYTDIIEDALSITAKMAFFDLDKKLSTSILSLSSILHYKEALGLERAYGTLLIEEKKFTHKEYGTFMELGATQRAYIHTFNDVASQKYKKIYKDIIDSENKQHVNYFVEKLNKQEVSNLDSAIWFAYMTQYIDQVKNLQDKIYSDIYNLIKERKHDLFITLILWSIYINTIFAVTIFMAYIFKESSLNQIKEITEAMKHLAKGDRTIQLISNHMNDEIAQMIDAYEINRQKLLKADILAQLYLSQKDMQIRQKERENYKLEKMAFIDPLTGILNRRKFEIVAKREIERSIRYKHPLSFLMMDLDHFKKINDTYGHAAGDEVLKHFTHICRGMIRGLDVIARIGGEEFIIMLPETDVDSAYNFAQRLRQKISDSSVTVKQQEIHYKVSIGIATLENEKALDINNILEKADIALYAAKGSGRNRVVVYDKSLKNRS